MSNAPEPLDPSFQLKLPAFEGPLDLLLFLVQKHDLAILELPVAFVTERYLEYLGLMTQMNLDIAAEYLVMAATLAYIKSKMLLPPDPTAAEDEEDVEDVDPRAELIRRLLEYQKYKQAAADLGARGVTGRDVFLRGMEAPEALGDAPLAEFGLFKLLDAFKAVLERTNKQSSFAITHEGVSIHDRMRQLVDKLALKRTCRFEELFEDTGNVYDMVVTFLAILEMAKRRLARIYQSGPIAPIHLEYAVLAEGETEEALAAPTSADGEHEPVDSVAVEREEEAAEAELDRAVAEPGEDPLGPALDEDEARLASAYAADELAAQALALEELALEELAAAEALAIEELAAEMMLAAEELTRSESAADEAAEAELDRAVAEPGEDPLGPAVLDPEEDFSHSGDPAADPLASDDE